MPSRLIAIALAMGACAGDAGLPAERTAYVNAQVFDGERFSPGALVVEGDRIVSADVSTASERVDLGGGFVVPPFCEAHNHNLGGADRNDETIAQYLREGIYYVGILSNLPALTDPVRHTYNTPTSLDVVFANGPITAAGGHPIRIREMFLDRGFYPGFTRETLPGQGYFVIDDGAALDRLWPEILKLRPDIIKIVLIASEEFEKRRDDAAFFGSKGLDPALAPQIVERAHAVGLRVAAHIETAHDFHVAIAAGVDVIAHLGGLNDPVLLDPADAALAAERGVKVMTTASLIQRRRERLTEPQYAALADAQKENLRILRDAGVMLAVGSDEPRATSTYEVEFLRGLKMFTNAEMLRMWSINCATTLFPERRLGRLQPGYEASFLVLAENPLSTLDAVSAITLRVKEGRLIDIPADSPPPGQADEKHP